MNVLTNLVKKNLILNKRRTIVTIISIILSCALIGGVATLIGSFQKFMQDIEIEENGNYHAIIKDVPVEKVKYIEGNAYIKDAMKNINLGYAKLENSKNEYKQYLYVVAYDKSKFENMPLELLSGKLPQNENEIIISNQIELDAGIKYQIGDTLTLNIGKRMLGDTSLSQKDSYNQENETFNPSYSHNYKIVGIVSRPTSEPYNAPGYTVITYLNDKNFATAKEIDLSVLVKNPNNIYNQLDSIAKSVDLPQKGEGDGRFYDIEYHNALLRWYGVTNNDSANSMLYGFAMILIVVIMIASIIVIYNSFSISVMERKKQFGMLASIGTTPRQIRNMVLKEGLLLSLIGIPLGIISSIIGIGITLNVVNGLDIFSDFYQSRLNLTVSSLSILVTVLFGGLTIFLSSLIPAIKASKTSPIDAIRMTSDIKIKGKKLRTPKFIRKLFGIEGELGLKSMKRNRKKYRSTIISLFVSIVLFMTINSFAEYSFRSTLKVYNDVDFNVGVMASKDVLKEIAKLDYVDEYTITESTTLFLYLDKSQINNKIVKDMKNTSYNPEKKKYQVTVRLSSLDDKSFKRYLKEINSDIKDYQDESKVIFIDKSNFYSQSLGKYFQITLTNLEEKDKVKLENGDVVINNIRIGKITSKYPFGFNNADSYSETIQGFVTEDVFDKIDASIKNNESTLIMQSSNPTNLVSNIEALSKNKGYKVNVQNIDDMVKTLKNIVLAISIFLYGFITLVSLITITNVINTITTSIYLRRREFAMIKAVGMTNKDFNKMIRFESVFYGLKSLLYGLPMGILIDYFMYKNVSSMFVYDYEIPFKPIFICVAFVFIIISITMTYSVKKIKNDNIVDVIKQENL